MIVRKINFLEFKNSIIIKLLLISDDIISKLRIFQFEK